MQRTHERKKVWSERSGRMQLAQEKYASKYATNAADEANASDPTAKTQG